MFVHQIYQSTDPSHPLFLGEANTTYGDLRESVHLYRNTLAAKGVKKGDRVGLYSANRAEFIYVYMAVVSLGAVIVPINNYLVSKEVSFIVSDAGIRLLIADVPLESPAELMSIQQLDQRARTASDPEAFPFPDDLTEDDVCSFVYTSGTTGSPKGAMLTHRNLTGNADQFNAVLPQTEEDNILCILPMFHCYGWTTSIMNPISRGCSITVLRTKSPTEIVNAIIRYHVTVAFMVPPMYHLLARRGDPANMNSVRFFVSGGACLPQPVAQAFIERYHRPVLEGYGLTEASPVVSVLPPHHIKYLSVGPALPGIQVKVLSEDHTVCEPGVVGELYVKGVNVMKGYWHKPEETENVLSAGGWLRTGDLAYLDDENYIYIVDRVKDLIIMNGENIYPGEVESCLYEMNEISECAVIGHPDPLRGQAIWAYVVMKDGFDFNEDKIRRYLMKNLAAYKIPRRFIPMDALPKNPTGKILKRVLRND